MDTTIKQPIQIFINNKFFIVAEKVEIKRSSAEFKKINPNVGLGTVINIVKTKKDTKAEEQTRTKELEKKEYDQWFHKMVKNRETHEPV